VSEVREVFCQTVEAVVRLVGSPELEQRWHDPSALSLLTVAGLAGHLLRAVTSVEAYLERPEPTGEPPIGAARYFSQAVGDDDGLAGAFQTAIRQRGEEAAAGGPETLRSDWREAARRLRQRLAAEPPDRLMRVYKDMVIGLDDYLATRLVELCVHADDLAASLDLPGPALPEPATAAAVRTLVDVARIRHGDAAVLRALARRERDAVSALRVL
jgi:mycothiol maleylpyruvate isomerase-like protein